MQAKETKLQDILEGTKQYVIPLFQRTYSWEKKEWEILWNDLEELCNAESPKTHFMGSIVNMPTISVPEGVNKFLLIDGQQRLTTIFVVLALMRDNAKSSGLEEFAAEINDTLLVNRFKKDADFYKLMPTQVDRQAYYGLVRAEPTVISDNRIVRAYAYFEKKLRQDTVNLQTLKRIITGYLSVVSIVLDPDDNPYLVFESLNAKGRPLTQADLIRNYFFMRIHVDQQEEVYKKHWEPMQTSLKDNLTEFIRHFLMREGTVINQADVYYALKEKVTTENAIDYLKTLAKFSSYYMRLLDPFNEPNVHIRKQLSKLKRIEVTTAYPLLLNFYEAREQGKMDDVIFTQALAVIENYLIRRFVCNVPTHSLNKIFPALYLQLLATGTDNLIDALKITLQSKGYPKDAEFKARLLDAKLYAPGDRAAKTKLILECMEESYEHKEPIKFEDLTVEHIMPQTLSEWWQDHLGEGWEVTHELYLHVIGNLTLTAYNAELANDDYPKKRDVYKNSHLELNKYFETKADWRRADIEQRSAHLLDIALKIWPYFGPDTPDSSEMHEVKGASPHKLFILGQHFSVKTWRDVLEQTLNTIADLEPDAFQVLADRFSKLIGKDKSRFRAVRQLNNGMFVEVNLSAQAIQRLCQQAIETIGLTSDDWQIETALDDAEPTDVPRHPTGSPKVVPVNFHAECVRRVEKALTLAFSKKTALFYESDDRGTGLLCCVSKEYQKGSYSSFWYGFHLPYRDYLKNHSRGFVCFGCGSSQQTILIPIETFEPLLDHMTTTKREDGMYWHVRIYKQQRRFLLGQPSKEHSIDITMYLI